MDMFLLELYTILERLTAAIAMALLLASVGRYSSAHDTGQVGGTVHEGVNADFENQKEKLAPPTDDELRQMLTAFTRDLNATDFERRQKADEELESYIRKTGQHTVDLLAQEFLPTSKARGDQEVIMRINRLLLRLTSPTRLWTHTYDAEFTGNGAVKSRGNIVQFSANFGRTVNLVLNEDPKIEPQTGWWGASVIDPETAYRIEADIAPNGSAKNLSAYRRKDGSQLWTQDINDLNVLKEKYVAFALANDETRSQVILAADNFCVAAYGKDGKRKWVNKPEMPRGNYKAALTAAVNGSAGMAFVTRADTELVAINLDNGSTAWRIHYQGVRCEPATENDRVYLIAAQSNPDKGDTFYAVNVKDGKEIWHTDINWGFASSCAKVFVLGNKIVASAWNGIYGLNKEDGKQLWRRPFPLNYNPNAISVFNDTVYAGAHTGEILAARVSDGTLLFRTNLADLEGAESAPKIQDVDRKRGIGNVGAPFVVNGSIYAITASRWAIALRAPEFELKKQQLDK